MTGRYCYTMDDTFHANHCQPPEPAKQAPVLSLEDRVKQLEKTVAELERREEHRSNIEMGDDL